MSVGRGRPAHTDGEAHATQKYEKQPVINELFGLWVALENCKQFEFIDAQFSKSARPESRQQNTPNFFGSEENADGIL